MWRQWNHCMQKNTRHCWNCTYFLRLTLLYRIYFICGCLIKWECFQNIFVHFFHTIVLLSWPNWDQTVCVWPMNDYKFDWKASTFPPFDTCNKKKFPADSRLALISKCYQARVASQSRLHGPTFLFIQQQKGNFTLLSPVLYSPSVYWQSSKHLINQTIKFNSLYCDTAERFL